MAFLNSDDLDGCFIGRVWRADVAGPSLVTLRGDDVVDITSAVAPTVRDVMERDDTADYVKNTDGEVLGSLDDLCANKVGGAGPYFLAPCDFQSVKACGVTFAQSMLERVIEEQAAGDPARAGELREKVSSLIGDSLRNLKAGSAEAQKVKQALIDEGVWSQYLEVGIGPDAEVFSKAQVLSSVGSGAQIGLHPISKWNNPEPEVVLAVTSKGVIKGATLGNDVNLRDVEGRSALLLSKAKDNNASCAIGPMIRLFDESFTLDDVRKTELTLKVEGAEDDFVLDGTSSMSQISRDPEDLVAQTIGAHHQYPDGLMLFLGTLFAPTQDRDVAGEGFTHKMGDVVTIKAPKLGELQNEVALSTQCPPWVFGASHLMRNLAKRGLL